MSDLIDRQAAIDALNMLFKKQVTQFDYEGYEKADEKTQLVCDGISESIGCVLNLPSAQPEKTQLSGESTTKDSTFDCISRQAAIDAVRTFYADNYALEDSIEELLEKLPSAQPEIIQCKDCRYWDTFPSSTAAPDLHECKTGIVMHWHTKANDFCSRAERRQDD